MNAILTRLLQAANGWLFILLVLLGYALLWVGLGIFAYFFGPLAGFGLGIGVHGALLAFCRVPLGYSLRNLAVRWPVSLLTALAFTLVVGLLTVMLAFVGGMQRLTENSGFPGNVIVLSDGATDELFSNLGYGSAADIEYSPDAQPRVLRDGKQPLVSREVYIVVNQPIPVAAGERPRRRFLQVRGIDNPQMSGRVHNLELYEGGNWFTESGLQPLPGGGNQQAIQAVLGEGIAHDLGRDRGKPSLEVGDLFECGGRQWVVTGITKSMGSTFGSEIWAKRSLVGPMFGKENYTAIVLRTANADDAKGLAEGLTRNYTNPAVQAQPEKEYYAKLSSTNEQFLYAIIFVAAIMSVGGVFGVMNTMFAAISQRTRDIGVLRIVGFAPWQVLVTFFIESLWIALIGGALGCALSLVVDGYTASSIVSGGQGGGGKSVVFRLIVDTNILAIGMMFTLAMGGLGGLLPALSAMRLRPLEAIR